MYKTWSQEPGGKDNKAQDKLGLCPKNVSKLDELHLLQETSLSPPSEDSVLMQKKALTTGYYNYLYGFLEYRTMNYSFL